MLPLALLVQAVLAARSMPSCIFERTQGAPGVAGRCDGGADDTLALQLALTACSAAREATVLLEPCGRWSHSDAG
jgi:hypothetical protein